jgi:hypothetical protein
MKLEICIIPEYNWGKSLAQLLPTEVWDKIRREVYADANWICQICYSSGVELHCHEVWLLDKRNHTQKLVKLVCICNDCHHCIHWWGTVSSVHKGELKSGVIERLTKHFLKVNKITQEEFDKHKTNMLMESILVNKTKKWRIDWGIYAPNRVVQVYNKVRMKR